jgi:hypothetical protein
MLFTQLLPPPPLENHYQIIKCKCPNYDGDLQKYNYLYLFEEIEKLSHLVWDGVPNKFYYLVEKFLNSFIKFLSFLSICYLVLGNIL